MGVQQHGGLPAGYQEVEYIGSTGTQWIDTGVKLNNNSGVDINAKFTATLKRKSYYLFGSSFAQKRYMIAVGSTTDKYLVDFNSANYRINSSVSAFDGEFHIHKINNLNYYIDNILQGSQTSLIFSNTENAYLFDVKGRSTDSSVGIQAWQIKYCKIYDNDTLVRNFVPCYRKSDNVVGMFDTAEGKFYTNQGTGEFSYPIDEKYTPVEYLESTGTQYIDTGIKLNQNSRVKIKYQYSAGTSTARVFGDAHNNSKGWILTTQNGTPNTKIQTLYGDAWKPQANEPQSIIPSTNIVEFERNGVNQYVNNNLYYTNPSSNFETTSTAIVFGAYYMSLSLSSIKLYELWIWEDGTNISRHFQPCYRKSDNKPGLYDTVTKEFYTNQGTGEFLYE